MKMCVCMRVCVCVRARERLRCEEERPGERNAIMSLSLSFFSLLSPLLSSLFHPSHTMRPLLILSLSLSLNCVALGSKTAAEENRKTVPRRKNAFRSSSSSLLFPHSCFESHCCSLFLLHTHTHTHTHSLSPSPLQMEARTCRQARCFPSLSPLPFSTLPCAVPCGLKASPPLAWMRCVGKRAEERETERGRGGEERATAPNKKKSSVALDLGNARISVCDAYLRMRSGWILIGIW